jgi:Beta-glucanase/Beta-glucan synthetase
MKKLFVFAAVAVGFLFLQSCRNREGRVTDVETPDGYKLVWQDEFDGKGIDGDKWTFVDWAPGKVNNELQRYVPGGELDGKKTAFVKDGVLNICAIKHNDEVISARMNSTGNWRYGYMEARIKLPVGKGTWPAFWMMPVDFSEGWPQCGEIDIMEEIGADPNVTTSSIHCKEYYHVIGTQKTAKILTENAETDFHVYAVEWTEDCIKSFRDGELFFTFENDKTGNDDTWPFNKPFYLILNLAWGGDWGGCKGVDESALPCTYQIDYVRVFQKK